MLKNHVQWSFSTPVPTARYSPQNNSADIDIAYFSPVYIILKWIYPPPFLSHRLGKEWFTYSSGLSPRIQFCQSAKDHTTPPKKKKKLKNPACPFNSLRKSVYCPIVSGGVIKISPSRLYRCVSCGLGYFYKHKDSDLDCSLWLHSDLTKRMSALSL